MSKRHRGRNALLEEYRQLNEEVRNRGQTFALVQSILITSSILIFTTTLNHSTQIINVVLVNPPPPSLIISMLYYIKSSILSSCISVLAAFSLVLIACLMEYTTRKLDDIFFERIHELEEQLSIIGGHHMLREKIKKEWYYKLRRALWPLIFTTLLLYYLCHCYLILSCMFFLLK